MKNLLLSILLICVFGCQLNGQEYSGDELGITSPKSFTTFIKSIESNTNLLSEGPGYKEYEKIIVKNSKTFTIKFMVRYDEKNKIPHYQGDIVLVELLNGKKRSPYTISNFRYSTYKDLIIGEILHDKRTSNIPSNIYSSIYAFETIKGKDINDAESEEIVKTTNKMDFSEKYTLFGVRGSFENGSIGLFNGSTLDNFYTLDQYSIISITNPILIQEESFWENNGNINSRGTGYSLTYNHQTMKSNDTLSYVYYNKLKRNGRIINYKFINNSKLEMEIGTYKDGIPVGQYTKYRIEPQKNKRVKEREIKYDQNGSLIYQIVYNSTYLGDNPLPTVYVQTSIEYNPKTNKMNGEYKTYHGVDVNGESILEETGFYTEDKRTGIWKKFYGNGQLDELINYTTGQSEKYNNDGSLVYKKYKN